MKSNGKYDVKQFNVYKTMVSFRCFNIKLFNIKYAQMC